MRVLWDKTQSSTSLPLFFLQFCAPPSLSLFLSFFSSIEALSPSFLSKALSRWQSSFFHGLFPSGWRLLSHFLLYLSLHLHGGKSPLKDLIEVQRSSLHRSSTIKLPSKSNKLGFLTHKYELFTIEEGEDIQCMSSSFQTILNKLRSLGWNFDNYDHIDKILRSLSRKWRPHVTALRALKNHDTMSLEELLGTLKFMNKNFRKMKDLRKGSLWLLASRRPRKHHPPRIHLQNQHLEARPKL